MFFVLFQLNDFPIVIFKRRSRFYNTLCPTVSLQVRANA